MFPHAAGLHSIGSHNNHTIITPFVTIPGLLTRIGTNSTMVATATAVPNDRTVSTLPEHAASIALRTYSACTLPAYLTWFSRQVSTHLGKSGQRRRKSYLPWLHREPKKPDRHSQWPVTWWHGPVLWTHCGQDWLQRCP